MANRKEISDRAEAAAAQALSTAGFAVTNLNHLAENCPFMDLLARAGQHRLLVQVKGTTTRHGKFGAPPHTARALARLAAELDCHATRHSRKKTRPAPRAVTATTSTSTSSAPTPARSASC